MSAAISSIVTLVFKNDTRLIEVLKYGIMIYINYGEYLKQIKKLCKDMLLIILTGTFVSFATYFL